MSSLASRKLFVLYYLITFTFHHSHPSITVSKARHDESTGNLGRHVRNCSPTTSNQTRALAAYISGSTYTEASHRMKLVLWVARNNRPFAIVEDKLLIEIFTDLNPNCLTRSRHTVSRDIKEMFKLTRQEVGHILQVSNPFSVQIIV
jgi:hypothetical protein